MQTKSQIFFDAELVMDEIPTQLHTAPPDRSDPRPTAWKGSFLLSQAELDTLHTMDDKAVRIQTSEGRSGEVQPDLSIVEYKESLGRFNVPFEGMGSLQ